MTCTAKGACRGHCYTPYTCGIGEHGRAVDTQEHEPIGVWFCGDEPEESITSQPGKTNTAARLAWFLVGMAATTTLILVAATRG